MIQQNMKRNGQCTCIVLLTALKRKAAALSLISAFQILS